MRAWLWVVRCHRVFPPPLAPPQWAFSLTVTCWATLPRACAVVLTAGRLTQHVHGFSVHMHWLATWRATALARGCSLLALTTWTKCPGHFYSQQSSSTLQHLPACFMDGGGFSCACVCVCPTVNATHDRRVEEAGQMVWLVVIEARETRTRVGCLNLFLGL